VLPVTAAGTCSRRRVYRIADNFLAFWLGLIEPYGAEIERGLGSTILKPLVERIDDHMGPRWEEAFRAHLRRMAIAGQLPADIVRIGAFWSEHPPVEIDAVALAGRRESAILAGEAKWSRDAHGRRIVGYLRRKTDALPRVDEDILYAVCARERVVNLPADALGITSADIFG
jgi:hypothetical protein